MTAFDSLPIDEQRRINDAALAEAIAITGGAQHVVPDNTQARKPVAAQPPEHELAAVDSY
jgi:hypothetical protein